MALSLVKWFLAVIAGFNIAGAPGPVDSHPSGGAPHPLYISVTEINHNAKDKTLEISCKIFTNDFETALAKTTHSKVDLSDPKDKKTMDKLVSEYILKHLQLKVDGRPVTLVFAGSEKETDATWSYFQVNNIATVKRIELMNNLLYDSFEQEINIVHVTVGGDRKSTRLNYPVTGAVIEF